MLSAARRRSPASAGMIAWRVTLSTVAPAASSAANRKIRPTGGSSANVIAASPAAEAAIAVCANEHQAPPLDPVGDRPAEQRADQDRHQLHDPQQPDQRRRVREHVDLERDRDQHGVRPEARDQLPDHEQPQGAVVAQDAQIHRDPPLHRRAVKQQRARMMDRLSCRRTTHRLIRSPNSASRSSASSGPETTDSKWSGAGSACAATASSARRSTPASATGAGA